MHVELAVNEIVVQLEERVLQVFHEIDEQEEQDNPQDDREPDPQHPHTRLLINRRAF